MSVQPRPDVSKYFQQLSGAARQGLTILVIGEPGSGKTTLVSNLLGVELTQEDSCESAKVPGLAITIFKRDILGIPVTIHETYGPESERYPEHPCAQNIGSLLNSSNGGQFAIIYCFKMCETRMRNSLVLSLQRCNEMGLVWEKTVIALTFADALPVARAVRQDPSYSQAKNFDERLNEWMQKIGTLLRERFGVPNKSIPMVPTVDSVQEVLPNQKMWYIPFWTCVLSTINKHGASDPVAQQPDCVIICTETATASWKPKGACNDYPTRTVRQPLLQKEAFKCKEGHGGYDSMDDTSEEYGSSLGRHCSCMMKVLTACCKACFNCATKCY